ncbi:MAG: hypothetical protein KF798_01650 [Candidatus Paracaedibacteraceae bacterium]|nr:hypothetical protein [Candidatus Paracaedibacteraceae bacterium]
MSVSPVLPLIVSQEIAERSISLFLKIPGDLYYLEGHFPGFPIVAGVVQLHWAVTFAQHFFDLPKAVRDVSKMKFSNLMRPDDSVCLTLILDDDKQLVSYRFDCEDKNYATGCFSY